MFSSTVRSPKIGSLRSCPPITKNSVPLLLQGGILTFIFDPPWNARKAREKYEGRYIGKFTKLKEDIVKLLNPRGKIISAGYKISYFGKKRGFNLEKVLVVNPGGDINPFFIVVERKETGQE